MTCESTGSRPAATISWYIDNVLQTSGITPSSVNVAATDTYTVTSRLQTPATKSHNQKNIKCKVTNVALPSGTETVQVITVLCE